MEAEEDKEFEEPVFDKDMIELEMLVPDIIQTVDEYIVTANAKSDITALYKLDGFLFDLIEHLTILREEVVGKRQQLKLFCYKKEMVKEASVKYAN